MPTPKKPTPKKLPTKVPQSVIDEMKKIGMGEAIKKANSGSASAAFVEGAKRMYGKRVNPSTPKPAPSQTSGRRVPHPAPAVIEDPKSKTVKRTIKRGGKRRSV